MHSKSRKTYAWLTLIALQLPDLHGWRGLVNVLQSYSISQNQLEYSSAQSRSQGQVGEVVRQ